MLGLLRRLFQPHEGTAANNAFAKGYAPAQRYDRGNVAQERAISERIRTSKVVKIEEEYDDFKDGAVGLKGEQGGVLFGVKGTGRQLVRRRITFIGHQDI